MEWFGNKNPQLLKAGGTLASTFYKCCLKNIFIEMHKAFEYIMEIVGWLRIVASPLLIGLCIGAIIYFPNPTFTTLIIAIIISVLGLLVGIIWATKIWKTKGTMWFVSQVSATPDFDNPDNNKKK